MLATDSAGQLKQKKRINRKLTQAANANAFAVLNVVSEELKYMNGVNMATALHRIARHCVKGESGPDAAASPEALKEVQEHPAYAALLQAVEQQAEVALFAQSCGRADESEDVLPAQCASIIAWSLACLDIYNERLLSVLAALAVPGLKAFKFYEVTNMLWAYAKLKAGGRGSVLIEALAQRLRRRRLGEYKPHCLTLALWSFAELGVNDMVLADSIASELRREADCLQPQEVCNISWALAHGFRSPRLLDTLREALAGDVLRRFKPHEFSSLMQSITTGGVPLPGLFGRCGAPALRLAKSMKAKHILSTLKACEVAGCRECPDLVPRLLDVAVDQIGNFEVHELVAATCIAAELYPEHPGFFKAYATCLVPLLSELSVDNLADLSHAFIKCRDTASASWIMYYVQLERRSRIPQCFSPTRQSISTASTTPDREGADSDGLPVSSDEDVQWPVRATNMNWALDPRVIAPPDADAGASWKVLQLRPPPGLSPMLAGLPGGYITSDAPLTSLPL